MPARNMVLIIIRSTSPWPGVIAVLCEYIYVLCIFYVHMHNVIARLQIAEH